MGNPSGGRLVLTHSTYIPGLIPILERLTQQLGVQTITPAVIGSARSHAPCLKLKVSVPIRGGFKLIARQGKTFQEVFMLTNLNQEEVEQAIEQAIGKR
jgi:hypothetical protein